MQIAKKLGLEDEVFCRMVVRTKMLFSNVLGHAAELHYEKYLESKGTKFKKAGTDEHFDYIVQGKKDQVKRWETDSTSSKNLGVNLTQTHGDRSAQDAFYKLDQFDRLVLFDVGFRNLRVIDISEIPTHPKYSTHLIGKTKWKREVQENLSEFDSAFLSVLKIKNSKFPDAVELFRKEQKLTYSKLLEKCCNLNIEEIDSLFSIDNFRLITGAKGFAAEEHFNVFLENRNIKYKQETDMYSKVDHWVNKSIRVQVKIPHQRSATNTHWAFKTHKSHGHGVGELYKKDMFDVVALFIGFEIDEKIDKYLPISVKNNFILIPINDIDEHPNHPGYLKRVTKVKKDTYKINDSTILQKPINHVI